MPKPQHKPLSNTINLRLRQPRPGSFFHRLNRSMENANPSQHRVQLLLGDCLVLLPTLADKSIDAIVCDPPYGLSFMGAHWDHGVPSIDIWRECLRVLKPGGHLLASGGTRTMHRIVCAIEDAGFEVRDQMFWCYGSGLPKVHDIGKAIDKAAGAKRKVGPIDPERAGRLVNQSGDYTTVTGWSAGNRKITVDPPATDDAKKWDGWTNALKPAVEPIVVARKPLERGLTLAQNVVKYGTGGLNIGACRVGEDALQPKDASGGFMGRWRQPTRREKTKTSGRYPANLILSADPDVSRYFPQKKSRVVVGDAKSAARYFMQFPVEEDDPHRILYVAKVSKAEREFGMAGVEPKPMAGSNGEYHAASAEFDHMGTRKLKRANNHPTCKPLALMRYLVRLVTPPGGVVLDPFMGSGSTGIAALQEGFRFIGIEQEPNFHFIAEKRIAAALLKKAA